MMKRLIFSLLLLSNPLITMDNPTPRQAALKQIEKKVRDVVRAEIKKIEAGYALKSDQSFYYRPESPEVSPATTRKVKPLEKPIERRNSAGVLSLPHSAIDLEVNSAQTYIRGDQAVMCADNKLWIVDHDAMKVIKRIQLKARVEGKFSRISALLYARLMGAMGERILLGEDSGRMLIVDPETLAVKTFGDVGGHVLSFASDTTGSQVAIRFTSKDSNGLALPCFALCAAYKKPDAPSEATYSPKRARFSWVPTNNWEWSDPVVQPCTQEVKEIYFEGDLCVTKCASGAIEQWALENPETHQAKLVRVSIKP